MSPFLHIWLADLAADAPGWPAAEASLSAAELARQARLRTLALRHTYARAHGFLRDVLGHYTSQPGAAIELAADANGKPVLNDNTLSFNLSYRPGRALLALSNAGPVGADLEPASPLPDAAPLVADLFSPAEQAVLQAAAPVDYWPLFYLIWTRKEAYAKALGMGLALPFREFSVLAPSQPPRLTEPASTSLRSFTAGAGWQGSIAVLARLPIAAQVFTYPPLHPSSLS